MLLYEPPLSKGKVLENQHRFTKPAFFFSGVPRTSWVYNNNKTRLYRLGSPEETVLSLVGWPEGEGGVLSQYEGENHNSIVFEEMLFHTSH